MKHATSNSQNSIIVIGEHNYDYNDEYFYWTESTDPIGFIDLTSDADSIESAKLICLYKTLDRCFSNDDRTTALGAYDPGYELRWNWYSNTYLNEEDEDFGTNNFSIDPYDLSDYVDLEFPWQALCNWCIQNNYDPYYYLPQLFSYRVVSKL